MMSKQEAWTQLTTVRIQSNAWIFFFFGINNRVEVGGFAAIKTKKRIRLQ